jgi:hypothetical protein
MSVNTADICGQDNFIGRSSFWWDYYLYAELDEYRFWSYARSENEIQMQRKILLQGNEPGLVAYYGFDEGGGSQCYDSTANHFDIPRYGRVGWVKSSAPILFV